MNIKEDAQGSIWMSSWYEGIFKYDGSQDFTSDGALLKLLFLVQRDVTVKWQKPMHNWNQILSQLSILYDDRLKLDI